MTDPSPISHKQYFDLTLDQVDELQSKPGEYILYYLGFSILTVIAVYTTDPEGIVTPLAAGIAAIGIFAYWNFVSRFARVLRLMTYPIWMWIPACVAPILPLPGILIVVVTDRAVSKSLTKALEQQD